MTDPYRPQRTALAGVMRAPSHAPTARLLKCGATMEQAREATSRWRGLSDAERVASQAALDALSDDELRQMIADG